MPRFDYLERSQQGNKSGPDDSTFNWMVNIEESVNWLNTHECGPIGECDSTSPMAIVVENVFSFDLLVFQSDATFSIRLNLRQNSLEIVWGKFRCSEDGWLVLGGDNHYNSIIIVELWLFWFNRKLMTYYAAS